MSTSTDLSNTSGFVCIPAAWAGKLKQGLINEFANPTPDEAALVEKINKAVDHQLGLLKEKASKLVVSIEENREAEAEAKEFVNECQARRQELEKILREIKDLEAKPAPAKPVIGAKKQSTKKNGATNQLCHQFVNESKCTDAECKYNHNMWVVEKNDKDEITKVAARESWPRDVCMFDCNNPDCNREHLEGQKEEQNGNLAFDIAEAEHWYFRNACKYGIKCKTNLVGECPFNHNSDAKVHRH